jgi:hypothetical protein
MRASARQLLEAIARETGIEVSGAVDDADAVSITIHDAPLGDALGQIFASADIDYVIVGSPPIRVWARSRRFAPPVGPVGEVPMVSHPPDPSTRDGDSLEDPPPADTGATTASDSPLADDPELGLLESAQFFEKAEPSSLLDAAYSSNPAVRERALRALAEREPAATPPGALIAAAVDADAHVSATATRLLDERNAGDAVEQIGALLQIGDAPLRMTAIELLRRRGDAAALAELRRALYDSDEAIRLTAQDLVDALERDLERRQTPPKN